MGAVIMVNVAAIEEYEKVLKQLTNIILHQIQFTGIAFVLV